MIRCWIHYSEPTEIGNCHWRHATNSTVEAVVWVIELMHTSTINFCVFVNLPIFWAFIGWCVHILLYFLVVDGWLMTRWKGPQSGPSSARPDVIGSQFGLHLILVLRWQHQWPPHRVRLCPERKQALGLPVLVSVLSKQIPPNKKCQRHWVWKKAKPSVLLVSFWYMVCVPMSK